MKKLILSLVAIVAATGATYAQSYTPDALKFSQSNYGSTARFKAMGGAQIGVWRRYEFTWWEPSRAWPFHQVRV